MGLVGTLVDQKFNHDERDSGFNSTDKPSKTIDRSPRKLFIEDRKTKYFGEEEFRRYSIDKPSHTLLTDSRDWFEGRPLTTEELAVIQGFRTDFKFYGKKTSVRDQIGNALPAAISKAFFSKTIQASII